MRVTSERLHYSMIVCRQTLLNISVRQSADYEKVLFLLFLASVHGDSAQCVCVKAVWLHRMAKQCFSHVLCRFLW